MIVVLRFLQCEAFAALSKGVNDDLEIGLLEADSREPLLHMGTRRQLLSTLLHEAAVQPKAESELLKIELDADNSRCGCPELLKYLFFLTLIRYADLCIYNN